MTYRRNGISRIGLGTVQFGLDYGISNSGGRVPFDEVERILGRAATLGIKVLDTAALYGVSEETLGKILGPEHPFHIVTKTLKVAADQVTDADAVSLVHTFDRSLTRLRQRSVYGLLCHDADDLLKPGGHRLVQAMQQLKDERRVTKIGVSIYTGEQLDGVLGLFSPDLVQLPINVLDQRLIEDGWLTRLQNIGAEVHARSVFLQGLLLMKPATLDSYFNPVRSRLESYLGSLSDKGATPLEGALQFALSQSEINTILVGVCSRTELEEVRSASMRPGLPGFDFRRWAVDDPRFVNPTQWPHRPVMPHLGDLR